MSYASSSLCLPILGSLPKRRFSIDSASASELSVAAGRSRRSGWSSPAGWARCGRSRTPTPVRTPDQRRDAGHHRAGVEARHQRIVRRQHRLERTGVGAADAQHVLLPRGGCGYPPRPRLFCVLPRRSCRGPCRSANRAGLDERCRIVRLPRACRCAGSVRRVAARAAVRFFARFDAVNSRPLIDEPVPLVVGDEIDQVLRLVRSRR